MKLKALVCTIIICTAAYGFADDPVVELFKKNIMSPYEHYFKEQRERVYIHFNRSEYIAGDYIWFKAFVYESKSKQPMLETNKLYTELFDLNGKLIERKILFVDKGVTDSYFKLHDNRESGIYTIRAYTNWMRNFNDQPVFNHTFSVRSVGSPHSAESSIEVEKEIDLQVFPEGGAFVEGIDNHFGVKVTMPDGHGTKVTGYVIGPQNDTLQTFSTNHLGIGDFFINAAKKLKYRVLITRGDKRHEIVIPEPVESGIGMLVNAFLPTKVIIAIRTNSHTAGILKGNNVLIMIHNNGVILKSSFTKVEGTGTVSIVSKSHLSPGVNYVTIFGPGFKPLAERLIYNNMISSKGQLEVHHALKNDSLTIDVTAIDTANIHMAASLSLSVLPANTVGNNFYNSLHSDMLLNSAITGSIESPEYYFESNDIQRQQDLDNLLLTQGWKGYKWPEILSGKTRVIKYPFEYGFNITATSENLFKRKREKNSRLSLFSPQNNLIFSSEVNDQGKASFENLYLKDSSHVVISATNLKGAGSNRKLIASVQYLNLDSAINVTKSAFKLINTEANIIKPFTAGSIELNEVVITGKKGIHPFTNSIYSSSGDQVHVITEDNYNQYTSIESLLRGKFFLQVTRNSEGDLAVDMGRGHSSLSSSTNPTLIIDGTQMADLSLLSMISIGDIESIAVNKTGASVGTNGVNGSINVITRKNPLNWEDLEYSNTRTILVRGYSKGVKFFSPKYLLSPESTAFQKFASIYWNPDINTGSTGRAQITFKIPKEISEYTIRMEGISQNGTVYFDSKKISTKSEP